MVTTLASVPPSAAQGDLRDKIQFLFTFMVAAVISLLLWFRNLEYGTNLGW